VEPHSLGINVSVCLECGCIKWNATYIVFSVNELSWMFFHIVPFEVTQCLILPDLETTVSLYLFQCY